MKYHSTYKSGIGAYSYNEWIKLKNMLSETKHLLYKFIDLFNYNLLYENTITKIENYDIEASFYFEVYDDIVTKSYKSNKTTTVTIYKDTIVTTLNLDSQEKIMSFLKFIGLIAKEKEEPKWMSEIRILDDDKQIELVDEHLNKIEELNVEINVAKDKLQKIINISPCYMKMRMN